MRGMCDHLIQVLPSGHDIKHYYLFGNYVKRKGREKEKKKKSSHLACIGPFPRLLCGKQSRSSPLLCDNNISHVIMTSYANRETKLRRRQLKVILVIGM